MAKKNELMINRTGPRALSVSGGSSRELDQASVLRSVFGSVLGLGLVLFLLTGCMSGPAGNPPEEEGQTGDGGGTVSPSEYEGSPELSPEEESEFADLADQADQAIRYGDYAAGIETYVNILGRARPDGGKPSPRWAEKAEKRLEEIGAQLSMLAAGDWLDSEGEQLEASVTALAEGKAPMPSVILTAEGGRFAVRDVPVAFEFVHGSGTLTPFVMTDSGGRAKSSVSRVDNPREEAVVRAALEFRGRNASYRFDQVFRDFTYLPPSQTGLIAGAVEIEGEMRTDPRITNILQEKIRIEDWEFSVREDLSAGGQFRRAFSGEPEALGQLAGESRASYLVMVVTTIPEVRQVSYGGQDFELYTASFQSSLRIIRTADGAVLYSDDLPDPPRGQGGTPRSASDDAVGKASGAWEDRLRTTSERVRKALSGASEEGEPLETAGQNLPAEEEDGRE